MHRRMHPQVKRAWEMGGHPLSSNPFFQKHGPNLHNPSFEASKSALAKSWKGPDEEEGAYRWDANQILEMMENIKELEAPHIAELEQAAVEIASQVWGIDPSKLRAKITTEHDLEPAEQQEQPEQEPEEEEEYDPDAAPQEDPEFPDDYTGEEDSDEDKEAGRHINHRVLMNMLTQGAATHQYNTLHHMAAEKVNAIDPTLLKTYTQFSSGVTHIYWIQPILEMMQNTEMAKGAAIGAERIEADENGEGVVVATGACFPVLLHELTKGIMELITYHQISGKDPVMQQKIVQGADKFENEPWMIMIGPEVWRRFLKTLSNAKIPSNRISIIIHKLSMAEPEEASEFIDAVVENPTKAGQLVNRFNAEDEQPEEDFEQGYEDTDPDAWKRGIDEALMSPAAPVAPPKPTTRPAPTRPTPGTPKRDPFSPNMPGKGKPGTLPNPKARDGEFGDEDMIDDISNTIGNEWDPTRVDLTMDGVGPMDDVGLDSDISSGGYECPNCGEPLGLGDSCPNCGPVDDVPLY